MAQRLRDAILIVAVCGALVATGWAIYGLGRRLPDPPPVRHPTVTIPTTPDESAENASAFTERLLRRY